MKTKENKRMDIYVSVFNMHKNNAEEKAKQEFIAQYGKSTFEAKIQPYIEKGIMSIFKEEPSLYMMAWTSLITFFVNNKF